MTGESFEERVQARIDRINDSAEALTRELGLPIYSKYEVLAELAGDGALRAQPGLMARNWAGHLLEDFVGKKMPRQLVAVRAIWNGLVDIPLSNLAAPQRRLSAAKGIGFASPENVLTPLIPTVAWTVTNWPEGNRDEDQAWLDQIERQATAFGCTPTLASAFRDFIRTQLTMSD